MSPAFGHYFNSTNKTFLVSSVMSSFNAQTVEQKEKELSKNKPYDEVLGAARLIKLENRLIV